MNEDRLNNIVYNNKNRASGSLIIDDLYFAYDYFGGKCPYSGTDITDSSWHLDHIIPIKMGGNTEPWNCIPVCGPCNLSKSDNHLLDWWDNNREIEEEYRLEKVFNYILYQLDNRREYKVSTDKEIEELINKDNVDDDINNYDIDNTYLDIYTLLFQIVCHMNTNKEYINGNIEEYITKLKESYINNKDFDRIDVELFNLENDITNYLREIGVIKHYSYAYLLAREIDNIDIIKNNYNDIYNYLGSDNNRLNDMINKNYKILLMDSIELSSKFEYIINIVGIDKETILEKPILLNNVEKLKKLKNVCDKVNYDILSIPDYAITRNLDEMIKILDSDVFKEHPEMFTSTTLAHAKLTEIQAIIKSDEFKEHPEMFTSTTLAHAKLTEIQAIIRSDEFKEHPELFTSETLAQAKLSEIQAIIHSDEFKAHPELFTSQTIAHAKLSEIQAIIHSEEFKEHPEMFTSTTLAHAKLAEIQAIIRSEEFKEHPEMFTSTTLAHAKLAEIQAIIKSEEFKEHPELFTSQTLARAKLSEIQAIIRSDEFKEHPEMFTSTTLAHAKLAEIQAIIRSEEFKEHLELFTSETLAHAKLSEIQAIIRSEEFKEHPELFTSTTLCKKAQMLFDSINVARDYGIDKYITTKFMIKPLSQKYALINYMIDNNIPLVVNDKLNSIFSYMPGVIKKKYGIDLKELQKMYPMDMDNNKGRGK